MGQAGSKRGKKGGSRINNSDAPGLGVSEETFASVPTVELEGLEELFHSIAEQNKEGETISYEKFEEFAKMLKTGTKLPTRKMFEAIDTDHSGTISKREFLAAMFIFGHGSLEERLKFVFNMYDASGKGKLDQAQIRKFVKACSKSAGLTVSLTELPINKDGTPAPRIESIDKVIDDIFKKFNERQGGEKGEKKKITFEQFFELAKNHPGIQGFIEGLQNTLPTLLHLDQATSSKPKASPGTPTKAKGRQGVAMEKQTKLQTDVPTTPTVVEVKLQDDEDSSDEENEGKRKTPTSPGPKRQLLSVQTSTSTSTDRSKSPPRVAMGSTSTKVKREFP